MRKAERLFQILTYLRSRRNVVTAQQLAAELAVSERTIYRDIQALSLSGVPIEAEAGVGYKLKNNFNLPPLMFDEAEIEALLVGVRMVESWSNKKMATSATSALAKIHAILPDKLHQSSVQQPEWVIVPKFSQHNTEHFSEQISSAIKAFQVVTLFYQDERSQKTQREIWPLGLIYWGKTWTIVAWCTKRDDYRLFRLDRIQELTLKNSYFQLTAEINLQRYIKVQTELYGEYL
ncbi:helix-turn-helix transcriptional regulator [Colwellia psychrerythraea]|uniref:WYL domain containing protein n=1 Tax=Colwellia psychrerythraea TaxID=28229 RepID=A0A099KYD7_COLPS|nr:YafY family protein [Colwellia psychrerythraea]KGJ94892.1 WYL domain containing protein [Colwellia psychrerythraea]